MARKNSLMHKGKSASGTGGTHADIFRQMEDLQRELLALSKRAEAELEATLRAEPQPVLNMLQEFATRVKATGAMVSFDSKVRSFSGLNGFSEIEVLSADLLQCDLALSGREMAMDFSNGRIFLPVVVFENPVAVAIFKVPALSSRSYESVCSAASEGICRLRNELKIPCGQNAVSDAAS
jgi:hypothetical protein